MTLRATANLTGAVTAAKGDDVSHHSAELLNDLISRGLVHDDGKTVPAERAAPVPKPAGKKATARPAAKPRATRKGK